MRGARVQRIVAAAGLAILATGCQSWRLETIPPAQLLAQGTVPAVRIVKKSEKSKVEVWDPKLAGDSIVGHPTAQAIARVSIPLGSIQTIETRHKSLGKTLLVSLAVVGGVAVYALLQSLNQGY